MHEALIDSLRRAVAATPGDLDLRVHLAHVLLRAGHRAESVRVAAMVLAEDPAHASGSSVIRTALAGLDIVLAPRAAVEHAASLAVIPGLIDDRPFRDDSGFDWRAAEEDLGS